MHARERERKKEKKRKKEKQRDQGKGGREPARAERGDRKKRKRAIPVQHGLASSRASPASTRQRKTRTNTRADPRKVGRRGREERTSKAEPETEPTRTQEPENGDKTPCILYRIPYKSRTPRQTRPHPRQITELVAQNPPKKTRRNKIELQKNKAKKRKTFCRRFQDEKQGFLGPKNFPEKTRTPVRVRCEKLSYKKT